VLQTLYEANGRFREFVPSVCCAHRWVLLPTLQQRCFDCGATCSRDRDGVIVSYSASGAGALVGLPSEDRAVA